MKNRKTKYLKKIFGLCILVFALKDSDAQNAIANGGFETTGNPIHYRQSTTWSSSTFASGWGTPNTTNSTPDIFSDNSSSACASNPCYSPQSANQTSGNPVGSYCYPEACVSSNAFGQQYPRTHSSDPFFNNDPNHNFLMCYYPQEYAYRQLSYSLVAGSCYQLTIWVSRADISNNAAPVEVMLSSTNPTSWTPNPADNTYSTSVGETFLTTMDQHIKYMTNKQGWTKVVFDFKAQGGEQYITIGLFSGNLLSDPNAPADCGYVNSPCNSGSCTSCQTTGFTNATVYFIDDVSLVPVSGGSFAVDYSYNNVTTNASHSNSNILITGNVTISGNVYWDNCQVRCNSGSTITVPSGSHLQLLNGTVVKAGCDLMWNGIVLNTSGNITVDKSSIEDALTAITINDASVWTITGTATQNSHFNRNVTDIIFNGNSSTGNSIKGATFDHSSPLIDPLQGTGGYGTNGIIFNGTSTGINETVGGPNSADICTFIGGEYGIRSTNKNLTIQRCIFSGIHQIAIDFQGSNPSNNLKTLNFISSSVVNSKRCILSQHRTDLTVQYSSFSGAQEHAIEWDDNHDGHLLIGDTADALKGNTFSNNAWAAIVAWDNHTNSTLGNSDIASNGSGLQSYTSIEIGNNDITTQPYAAGMLLGEWTLSSTGSYHLFNVKSNTINGTVKGIQIYNVRGWNGAFSTPQTNLPPSIIQQNQIAISTASVPNPFAINAENAIGLDYGYNLIGSDNPTDWQNSGIRLQNAEFSQVYNNGIGTGTGISAGLDMLSSGLYCNILDGNVSGITLGWAYLCPDVSHPHGSVAKAYSNAFTNEQSASVKIHDYYSAIDHNNWVWDNTVGSYDPFVWYSGISSIPNNTTANQTAYSLITTFTGGFDCPYDPGMRVVLPDSLNIHAEIDNDTNAQWRADYEYEIQRLSTGIGSDTVASDNIQAIIGMENNINTGNYQDALTALSSFTATNDIEENYKQVLTVFGHLNYPDKREATETEMDTLVAIAEQFPRNGGGAVTLARTFLAVKYNMYFKDEKFTDGVAYGTATVSSPCSLSPASGTVIGFMSNHGVALPFTAMIEEDGSFAFDPYQLAYWIGQNSDETYRIYSLYGSTYTVANRDFNTLATWISGSPMNLDLAGVSVVLDTTDTLPYESIGNYTSQTDAHGNVYSVGYVINSNHDADFLLEKRDYRSTLLWSQSYNGPASGNDTATCMKLDQDGNVYVAGKVYNGMNYDFQVLKYDPDGNLIWASSVADSVRGDNKPTGIYEDSNDKSVHVIGTVTVDGNVDYRFIQFMQCLPSVGGRIANPVDQSGNAFVPTIEYYPNPSTGSITITMKEPNGTLELYNVAGQLLFTRHLTQSGTINLPENQVPNGIYLLKFTGAGEPQFNKLVIQRN